MVAAEASAAFDQQQPDVRTQPCECQRDQSARQPSAENGDIDVAPVHPEAV